MSAWFTREPHNVSRLPEHDRGAVSLEINF